MFIRQPRNNYSWVYHLVPFQIQFCSTPRSILRDSIRYKRRSLYSLHLLVGTAKEDCTQTKLCTNTTLAIAMPKRFLNWMTYPTGKKKKKTKKKHDGLCANPSRRKMGWTTQERWHMGFINHEQQERLILFIYVYMYIFKESESPPDPPSQTPTTEHWRCNGTT